MFLDLSILQPECEQFVEKSFAQGCQTNGKERKKKKKKEKDGIHVSRNLYALYILQRDGQKSKDHFICNFYSLGNSVFFFFARQGICCGSG